MSKWNIMIENANGTKEQVVLDMPKEFDEKAKKEEKLWCKCNHDSSKKIETKYVENYMGISHGWICPICGKFTQIG